MDARTEWLQERQLGIGGSDAPVILGVSPWKSAYELWLEKTGPVVPESATTPDILRGKALEPMIADIYSRETGRALVDICAPFVSEKYPFMRGNIDRLIPRGGPAGDREGVLEIKAPRSQTFSRLKREGLPDYVLVQLQHYLTVTGLSWGSVAVFSADAWELIHFDVPADPALAEILVEKEAEFWHHVETGTQPAIDSRPLVDLPPVGGELVRIESDAWAKAVEDLRLAREIAEEAAAIEDAAKGKIWMLMDAAGAEVAEGAGARIYWKAQAGRKTLDKKALLRAHPEIDLTAFEKAGKPSRPFRVYFTNN